MQKGQGKHHPGCRKELRKRPFFPAGFWQLVLRARVPNLIRPANLLPKQCIQCEYRFACHGECPKNRISITNDGESGLNHLCSGLFNFFKHVHPYMQYMAEELRKERPPANVMQWIRKIDFRKSIKKSGTVQNINVKNNHF